MPIPEVPNSLIVVGELGERRADVAPCPAEHPAADRVLEVERAVDDRPERFVVFQRVCREPEFDRAWNLDRPAVPSDRHIHPERPRGEIGYCCCNCYCLG